MPAASSDTRCSPIAWLLAVMLAGAGAAGAAEILILPADARSLAPRPGGSVTAVNELRVGVDVAALARSMETPASLRLPDGSHWQALPETVEPRGGGDLLWRGRLQGDVAEGRAVITVHRGQVAGLITLPHRSFELVPEDTGVARLQELEDRRFLPCGGALDPDVPLRPVTPRIAPARQAIVDALVVYTPLARQSAGGQPQIEASIRNAVDLANDAYANSRVAQRVFLAGLDEVDYVETGRPMEEQLVWLRTDGEVALLRDRVGADVVALIAVSPDNCGLGYVMRTPSPDFAPWAFSVTHRPCLVGGRTLAHEFGHNMGLEHDPPNGPSPQEASYPWSFGHYEPGVFRTVMSYPDPCGSGCVSIGHFSNPEVPYLGLPTGVHGTRSNAHTLDLTGWIVEGFRDRPAVTALP